MTKIENKIGILINWPREFDMYDKLIEEMPSAYFEIIVNDIKGFDKERIGNSHDIEKILKLKRIKNYVFFSEIIKKKKFKILLSTGEACTHRLTVYSVLKWTYAQIIGRFLDFTKLSSILKKLVGRPFNAEGKFSVPFIRWFPERKISEISIKYPQGMDLNYIYPVEIWKKHFDIFFTHGSADSKMISKKFPSKKIFNIGYPRYINFLNSRTNQIKPKELINEELLDEKKETILWLPSHIKEKNFYGQNILSWIPKFDEVKKKYNLIIRPHPKTLKTIGHIEKSLKEEKLIIDLKFDRKIGELINYSNLILCDYGGPIYSSIYLEKNVLLLNYLEDAKFVKDKIESFSFDIEVRKFLTYCDLNIDNKELINLIDEEIQLKKTTKVKKIKNFYFGDDKKMNSITETYKYLLNQLNN